VDLAADRVAVASFVDQAVETTRAMFDSRQQQLTVSTAVDGAQVRGDETRLVQVVANLLHNASKYTPDGGTVRLDVILDDGDVRIVVADDGMGMPSELIPSVFDLFVQGDVSLDRSRGGLGIGLTLARQLVQLHGGTIAAASDGVGSGSEFTVRLPLDASVPNSDEPSPPAMPRADSGARHVLVVDDNVDMAETIAAMLEIEGHTVHVANSGADALDLLDGTAPDVVVCDIGLPGMDGYELARRMRERAGPLRLVALSGYGHDAAQRRATEAGFDVYLVKPVDLDTILGVIADVPVSGRPGTVTR
jgi:CheY-like chemotaxis protein